MESIVLWIQNNFTESGVNTALLIVRIVMMILVFLFVYNLSRSRALYDTIGGVGNKAIKTLLDTMNRRETGKLSYAAIERKLIRTGSDVHFKNMTPLKYTGYNALAAAFGFVFGFAIHPLVSIPLMIFGWYFFDILMWQNNVSDNNKMMDDIRAITITLKMQTRAGAFITSALAESYIVCKSPRIKKALLDLNGSIEANTDMNTAVDEFNNKFDNEYIDSLCVVLKQAGQSGKAAQSFKDVENNLMTLEAAALEKQKKTIENQTMIIELMIYFGVFAIIIYGLVLSLGSSGLF